MNKDHKDMRLSSSILPSLELAIEQKDVAIAEMLARALETSMTRNAGGQKFIERREYPEDVADAFHRLEELKGK